MSSHLYGSLAAALAALAATVSLTGGPAVPRAWPHGPPAAAARATQPGADLDVPRATVAPGSRAAPSASVLDGGLAGGMVHTCALAAAGAAYCWGYNGRGELGIGSAGGSRLVPVSVAGGLAFGSLSAGAFHTCGIAADATAYCWGDNRKGQLGDGTTEQRTVPTAVAGNLRFRAISAGVDYTCGVTVAGSAYCWGGNEDGQHGDGTTSSAAEPTPVRGGRVFVSISAGAHHTCALSADGAAFCWGANASGELGDGAGGRPGARALVPVPVAGGHVFSQIVTGLGARFTCGLTAVGVFCWGDGRQGQLGPDAPDVCAQYGYPCAMTPHAVAGLTGTRQVSLGVAHACALDGSGTVRCWGSASSGRLGDGSAPDPLADPEAHRATPAPVAVGGEVRFASVTANAAGACARTVSGQTLCWGRNALGILGDGTTEDRRVPTPVRAPDALPSPLPGAPPTPDAAAAPPEVAPNEAGPSESDADVPGAMAGLAADPTIGPTDVPSPAAFTSASMSPAAPQVALANSDSVSSRDDCLTIAAGSHGAYQCGDLRIVHPLPSVRTRSRVRVPTLVYNSQLAQPTPVIAADVTVPAGADVPDTVRATVIFDQSSESWTRQWPGSAWGAAGMTRRVAVPAQLANTPYHPIQPFTVDIAFCYNTTGCYHTVQTSMQMIWDRRASPFGAGWWIAGIEQLETSGKVVASGDGSAIPYRYTGIQNTWAKAPLDRPDTLQAYYDHCSASGCEYMHKRQAEHGGTVIFRETGWEEQAVGRLGDTTRFAYDQSGRLQSIELPPGGAAATYAFAYTPGQVQVTAPPAGSTARVTTIFLTGARVDSIRDPDAHAVSFTYDGSTTRITSRTNKRGWATEYAYDAGGKLAADSVPLNAGQYAVTRFESAESRGILQAVPVDSAYTLVSGPRGDTTVTRFWVGRFGAPRKIVNALGDSTVLTRGSAFPALVTEVRAPNGFTTRAAYDVRGNLDTLIHVNPHGDGRNDTTRYEWHSQWDFVTKIVRPERDSLLLAYDAATGSRLWQQPGADQTRRVSFYYYASTGLPRATQTPDGARDSLDYDARGNLSGVRTPLGYWTRDYADDLGRDTLVVSPIDPAQTKWDSVKTYYDVMDQDTLTRTAAPAMPGGTTGSVRQSVVVRKTFDEEGNLKSLMRKAVPNEAGIDSILTTWDYDPANRKEREITYGPSGPPERYTYDPAGNLTQILTRRLGAVAMTYDSLNRLTRRIVPQVTTSGVSSLADTLTFAYDKLGNLTVADNRFARIRRTYYPNGLLRLDSLRIRSFDETGTAADWDWHKYGLEVGYDQNGRRAYLKHPRQLAPLAGSAVKDSAAYSYDPITGELASMKDVLGHAFSFFYDVTGRLDSLAMPGDAYEKHRYDADGRETRRVERAGGTDLTQIRSDSLLYDARGKVVTLLPADSLWRYFWYSGLGGLIADSSMTFESLNVQWWQPDALQNVANYWVTPNALGKHTNVYNPTTGQLLRGGRFNAANAYDSVTRAYDADGNVESARTRHVAESVNETQILTSYFTADNKLYQVDKGVFWNASPLQLPSFGYGALDEYRYDALGRRVLVRSRHEYSPCAPDSPYKDCLSTIERYVWDGDRILYEMRYPGSSTYSTAQLERDTVKLDSLHGKWGRVAYLHGLGIDRPLGVIRIGYGSGFSDTITLVPHYNFQGIADGGTYQDGLRRHCLPGQPSTCVAVNWPAQNTAFLGMPQPFDGQRFWWGSLIQQQRTAANQIYMRNRYYDPETGRFAQEDPIGLAGGLNLYGFAAGDPVNFSDPFGLFDCDKRTGEGCPDYVKRLLQQDKALESPLVDPVAILTGFAQGLFRGLLAKAGIGAVEGTITGAGAAAEAGASGSVKRIFSARVLQRMAEDPGPFHNFPQAVGEEVFKSGQRTVISNNYVQYTMRGVVNGAKGTYEIGVRPSASGRTEVITHWFFRPDPK